MGLLMVVLATAAAASGLWEVGCGDPAGWTARPSWVSNPSAKADATAEGDALTFTVNEAGRGMKWTCPIEGLSAEGEGLLLVRCRAEGTLTGGPYALWGISASEEGMIVAAGDFPVDGQWHEVAVDLFARGRRGRLTALAVEVQAGQQLPARLSFGGMRMVEEPPDGASRLPADAPPPFEWREEFDGKLDFGARPAWLGNPASEGQYAIRQADGVLRMTVAEPSRGMKWSARFPEPADLTGAAYLTIRYRAANTTQWGDYFVWVGSEAGGQPQQSATLIAGTQVRADGRWHTETLTVEKPLFPIVEMAVQVEAGDRLRVTGDGEGADGAAWAEVDYVALTSRRPRLPIREVVDFEDGWKALRAPEGRFACVPLAEACNASGQGLARKLGVDGWFQGGRVTVEGVPFQLAEGETNVAAIPGGPGQPFAIPVDREASELFLLAAARLPDEDFGGILGGRALRSFRQPERFRIAVDYADGLTDWHFPARVADGVYEFAAGVDAYVLPGLRDVPIRQIRLRSAMRDSTIGVLGITAYQGERLIEPEAVSALPGDGGSSGAAELRSRGERQTADGDGTATVEGGRVVLSNPHLRAEFSTEGGLRLEAIEHRGLREGRMTLRPGPVFVLNVGGKEVPSTEVEVGEVREEGEARVVIPVDARGKGVPLAGELSIGLGAGPELQMRLDLSNVGAEVIRPGIVFPQVDGVAIGEVEDTWYLYAGRGGIINNRPIWIAEPYSGRHPLQVTDAFNPRLGAGLYLMTHDLNDIYKYYGLRKDADGVLMRADTFARDYQPGERIEVAPAVLGVHTGDWRAALAAYKQWAHSWYAPATPRKAWFKECFNYRQHLVRGDLYDFATQTYHMDETLEQDIDFFGRVDYFHIFDFGQSDTYGRVGDYSHYDEIGGRERLAEAIRGMQEHAAGDAGQATGDGNGRDGDATTADEGVRAPATGGDTVRVGLYIEGYLVDERGEFGREHVAQWHIIKPDGEPLLWPGTPTEHMMCPACEGWQDYLASTYGRVTSQLRPNGMYIDQHGFADAWKICYGPDHGHPVPQPALRGERDMGRKIRAAVPEEMATLTEEVPVDVNSQYQDGALGYSVAQADADLAPHRIQLFRFCFPDFKVFQLVIYNPFVDGGWELLKYPFFNGEGTWLGNPIPSGFDGDAQAFLRKSFALLHEHRAAFTSDDVEPLVPTENPLICANRFSGADETVWTLLNVGYSTYRGPVLRVKHEEGARYVDLWNGQELLPKVKGGEAVIEVELGPREVGCVGRR